MSPNMKLQPNLDQSSTQSLNLTVLQRIDPNVEEILITVAHVTFYEFNIESSEWSRKDVEGSLFVVKRNAQPRFQFIVMNRRNTDNLVENLLGDFEYEIQVPYLLYRNAAQEVNGIWFYHQSDCESVAKLFSRILNAYSKVSPKEKISSTKSEFDELEADAVPSMAVIEGPPEPSTASTTTNPEDSGVLTFFNNGTNIGKTSNALNPGQPHLPPGAVPLSSRSPNIPPNHVPVMQPPSTLPTSSALSLPLADASDRSINNHPANLVSPATFFMPPSSSMMPSLPSPKPTAPPLHLPMQRPYGAPLLQSYPPPSPPPSLTPSTPYNVPGPFISRDKVRDTLVRLVQNPQFIDLFYEELLKGTT